MEDKMFLRTKFLIVKIKKSYGHARQLSALEDLGITMCLEYKNLISEIFFPLRKEIMGTIFQDLNILLHIQSQGNFSIYILTHIAISQMTAGYRGKGSVI